jgi:hypothetical protein
MVAIVNEVELGPWLSSCRELTVDATTQYLFDAVPQSSTNRITPTRQRNHSDSHDSPAWLRASKYSGTTCGRPLTMAEFNSPLISRFVIIESRILEFIDKKHKDFKLAILRLSYTRFSLRLIRLMLQICPRSTLTIILGRFLEGIIPSIDLRIKGEFLDIVKTSVDK